MIVSNPAKNTAHNFLSAWVSAASCCEDGSSGSVLKVLAAAERVLLRVTAAAASRQRRRGIYHPTPSRARQEAAHRPNLEAMLGAMLGAPIMFFASGFFQFPRQPSVATPHAARVLPVYPADTSISNLAAALVCIEVAAFGLGFPTQILTLPSLKTRCRWYDVAT